MNYKEELKRINYKAGYVLVTGIVDGSEYGGADIEMTHAETPSGDYIGNSKTAYMICKRRGIKPEKRNPEHGSCSIGFCQKDQKWYGWSHRAIFGFGIGSKTSKGDCSYSPTDWDDFIEYSVRFWTQDSHEDVTGERGKDAEGRDVAIVKWVTVADKKLVPNEAMHGKAGGVEMYPPDKWGRGEWEAKTLEDAKQMACDFAEGVS